MGNKPFEQDKQNKLNQRNQNIATQKLNINERLQQINLDPKLKNIVLNSTASELVIMLNKGKVSSYLIVLILAEQTLITNELYNFMTEDNFDQALEMAQECDANRKLNP